MHSFDIIEVKREHSKNSQFIILYVRFPTNELQINQILTHNEVK